MKPHTAMATSVRRTRLAAWRHQHAWCARESLRRLWQRPLGSLLSIAVMGIALALPLVFWLLLGNLQQVGASLGDARTVSVFLHTEIAAEAAERLAAGLRARADIAAVTLRTPQQGLAELAAAQGYGDIVQDLPANPLPYALLVEPRAGLATASIEALVAELRAAPQVELVQDNGRWRARLDAMTALGRRIAWLLALLLGGAALLVIGNSVRLDLRGAAEEIAVQQWMGASPAFVRRLYLYEGGWYGLAAGVVAVLLLLLLEALLAAPVRDLVASYAGRWYVGGLPWSTLACVPAVAVALGWLGARVASARHLAQLRP